MAPIGRPTPHLTAPMFWCNLRSMATAVLIRAKLTAREWARIRKIAIDREMPVSTLVAEALRDALLKGAKP